MNADRYEATQEPDGTWTVTWFYPDGHTSQRKGYKHQETARYDGYAGMMRPSRFSGRQAQYGRYS